MTSSNVDWKPRVGMEFVNNDAAYEFWLAYSARVGFGVRKHYANKSKKDGTITSCRFVCCKQGLRKTKRDAFAKNYRAETRTDCKARISLVLKNGKFVINEFEEEHNHDLQLPETTHMLASHRKITEVQANDIDMADDSGLRQKSTFQLMSTHAGHRANVGYTRVDVKNYLNARRQRNMVYGEAGCLSQYFQRQLLENPSFFHAYQMDIEEQITNVHENSWIKRTYAIKEKWASCYMKEAFTLGMRSTQLSESLNAHFKSGMKPNVDIIQFFKHFERVVEEKRSNELTCEYKSLHKLPMLKYEFSPILIQMAKVYTHTVFELFQDEFKLFLALCISERNESHSLCQYGITMVNHEGSWRVLFDRASTSISCSCRKYETFGILCSHALKVYEANDVKAIPEEYILRRWTREARCGIVQDLRGKEVERDPKLSSTRRFRQVVSKFIKLAAEVSTSEEYHTIVDNSVDAMCKQIMELRSQARNNENHNSENSTFVSYDVMQPKGFKHRPGLKRQKRQKSWVECQSNKKKVPPRGQPRTKVSQDKELTSHLTDGVSCSAPPTYEPPQAQEDQFSFTALLMAPLNDP